MNKDLDLSYIKQNIDFVMDKITKASLRSGRNPQEIKVIAVSKTVDIDKISKAAEYGILDFGENKVQELSEKYDKISRDCSWHMIGHLQTNKVKQLVDKVSLIHSVDRIDLVKEIQKRAEKINRVINILIQVNVADEDTKFGIEKDQVFDFIKQSATYQNVKIKGLMTIAPFTTDTEIVRSVFKEMRQIFIDIKEENIDNIDMDFLSMGMSNDFEIAIEEGSNIVRIGTAIFGRRQY